MSRIGKKPIQLTDGIKSQIDGQTILIEGPQGSLSISVPKEIKLGITQNKITLDLSSSEKRTNLLGLYRSLIQNAVFGVKTKWTKSLELVGVGFKAETNGTELDLSLGFSHKVKIPAPKGISFKVEENKITVSGVDKYLVGEVAASIRRIKKPEPYKGKGIRYLGEYIRKKLGKAAKTVGTTGPK